MILGQARGRKYHLTIRKAVNLYSLSTWGIAFASILSLGFLTLTSSSVPTQASATSFETDVTVPTVLSLTIEPYDGSAFTPSDRMIVTADTAGTYTKTARITAQTNSQYGYKLFVADSDDITALAPVRSSSKVGGVTVYDYNIKGDTVEPIKNPNTALSNFANNTWGYAVETTPTSSTIPSTPSSYNPITINPTQLYATDSPSEGYHFFTFASKIDDTLDANTYLDQVTFTLTANEGPYVPSGFYELNGQYMQNPNLPTLCAEATTPNVSATELDTTGIHAGDTDYVPSITMVDKRDGQSYNVRKLADGNCWMTDNLRYGINPDGTMHSYVSSDGELSNNVNSEKLEQEFNSSYIENVAEGGQNFYDNARSYQHIGVSIYQANDLSSDNNTKYGAIYNFCAATGGTACTGSSTMPTPTGSICPSGWSLPTSSGAPNGNSISATKDGTIKDFTNLLNAHGLNTSQASATKAMSEPLNITKAGTFNGGGLAENSRDTEGRYWPISTYNAQYSWYLSFANGITVSQARRRMGFSVRCVL